ncbi:GNAT family N-acetyltransferase [Sutcliffiella horikoshii]|uniref:GNAT family N-acetyltransferase n=1 Tax=Sutcliffiella horikoshii TaxID=79883 RepID=A0A5D4SYY0_9BACI|nr:GNAT family N-acetyltransferase [Sutcliffiella horikoshii]TYS67518.1 GNAT family N-acetyltransferase [Sutcliffiella horikoshii]
MAQITLLQARLDDAEQLTSMMKKTFDEEALHWLGTVDSHIVDYNIQPPGYDSVYTTRYMIEELTYYKIMLEEQLVGGVILTITGKRFGRIDRIFIDPAYQGQGVGSEVIRLVEKAYPSVTTWDLETSPRQKGNLHFYEKMGFERTFETEDEVCYIKRIRNGMAVSENAFESCNLEDATFYQANLANSAFSNSTLAGAHFSNINLRGAKFQNINFRSTLLADLNLSGSRVKHVDMSGVEFKDTTIEDAPVSFERCELMGTRFTNCKMVDVEINACDISGMKIDGVSVEELLEVYRMEIKKKV